MAYREKLNIILMRDNGPRRSFQIRRSRFYLCLFFFLSLPFLTVLLATQSWILWKENIQLRESMEQIESEYQSAESRAERLEGLEELLKEENVRGRDLVLKQLAKNPIVPKLETADSSSREDQFASGQESAKPELQDGPGHEEFPAIDVGRVKVGNVQARIARDNLLRIGFDLRNPDNAPLLSGEIRAVLVGADGSKRELSFAPRETASFRINRFKRAVLTTRAPRGINLENSQIILEVVDAAGKDIYRNIFALQR